MGGAWVRGGRGFGGGAGMAGDDAGHKAAGQEASVQRGQRLDDAERDEVGRDEVGRMTQWYDEPLEQGPDAAVAGLIAVLGLGLLIGLAGVIWGMVRLAMWVLG